MAEGQPNFLRRIWVSVFPNPVPMKTERRPRRFLLRNLVLHFRPTTVPEPTLKFTFTWGLGGMAVVLVMLQIVTGVMLKFVYEPIATQAYASVIHLQNDVPFGGFIRNIHFWSANFLVVAVFLHLLRVFFTGAFHAGRRFTWVVGLILFFLVLASNFTGYLLPWDQLAYWAVTISTGMLEYVPGIGLRIQHLVRGGPEIGQATLGIFFALHTAVIPILIAGLMAFHFWRIRKAGGLAVSRPPENEPDAAPASVPVVPGLLIREAVVALLVIAFVCLMAAAIDTPVGAPANPGLSPNPTKAPWYFGGFQEMLLHFHPSFAVFVIPVIIFFALLLVPYVNLEETGAGIWFASRTGRRTAAIAAVSAVLFTGLLVFLDEFYMDWTGWMPDVSPFLSTGLIPAAGCFVVVAGCYLSARKLFSATRMEALQAVFVFLTVSFVVMTLTCALFRGQGMRLMWPWP